MPRGVKLYRVTVDVSDYVLFGSFRVVNHKPVCIFQMSKVSLMSVNPHKGFVYRALKGERNLTGFPRFIRSPIELERYRSPRLSGVG